LREGEVDVLELRVDAFAANTEELERAIPRLSAPLLLTVRHPREGGACLLTTGQRRKLVGKFLPLVSWLDLEVRSLNDFKEEVLAARELAVRLVVSDHHFLRTPPLGFLRERVALARPARPDVFKLATAATSPRNVQTLLSFLGEGREGTRSVMGMGPLGKVSRLLLGRCGSALNYGYLDRPQVPGQWEATLLKKRLQELREGEAGAE
jgi:3-dehydroquinate dehydratase-1